MRLTDLEYQDFKTRFHCTAWPDEDCRVPVLVDTPDGKSVWTAYILGSRFQAAVDWHAKWRSPSQA